MRAIVLDVRENEPPKMRKDISQTSSLAPPQNVDKKVFRPAGLFATASF
jgi:hypothetical protein